MLLRFRVYPDEDWRDAVIGYSPDGYIIPDAPEPPAVVPATPYTYGVFRARVLALAAVGEPFTVKKLMAETGITYRSAHLYELLTRLVADGTLCKSKAPKCAAVYQIAPGAIR
jgi:hypothetical protein